MGGGAWPFLVGGLICLVNSDNERDLRLLSRPANPLCLAVVFLEGLSEKIRRKLEAITGL